MPELEVPPCDVCDGPVPEKAWSQDDEAAEREEMKRTGNPHRPLYCSLYPCFDTARTRLAR